MSNKYLKIYLNDHLAGSVVGIELARRALASNRNTKYEGFLEGLVRDIDEDRGTLHALMDSLGMRQNRFKQAGGWIAEKAGRLKLNGQLTGYSPLSRLVELESLVMGVTGKLALWRALKEVSGHDPRLETLELDDLISSAESQIEALERHRLEAAAEVLAP